MTVPTIEVNDCSPAVIGASEEVEDETKDVIISCENIQKTYLLGIEGVAALRGVSLDIYRGEFVAIYGISGGGKTSLLNILGSIDIPTKGHLTINGMKIFSHRTTDADMAHLRLKDIGFVFQTFNLLPTLTAAENVELPMILHGEKSKKERADRVNKLLDDVGMLHRARHYPSMLSGGEQQRVTIARSLANSPSILLLDEPTGDLDTFNTCMIMELLLRLNEQQGITCVMVTHDSNLKNFAHRAMYISDGKLQRIENINIHVRGSKVASLRSKLASSLRSNSNEVTNESSTSATPPVLAPERYQLRTTTCAASASSVDQPSAVHQQPPPNSSRKGASTGKKTATVAFLIQEAQQQSSPFVDSKCSPSPPSITSPTPSQNSSSYCMTNFSTAGSSSGGSCSSASSSSSRTEHRMPQYYNACASSSSSSSSCTSSSRRHKPTKSGSPATTHSTQLLQQLFGNRAATRGHTGSSTDYPASTTAPSRGTAVVALKAMLSRVLSMGQYYVEKHYRQADANVGTSHLIVDESAAGAAAPQEMSERVPLPEAEPPTSTVAIEKGAVVVTINDGTE